MLTNHTIKVLQTLDKKKFRQKYNLFLVEGNKIIKELKNSLFIVKEIYSSEPECLSEISENIIEIDKKTLKKISFLQNPKDSIAVCELPEISLKNKDFNIVLDGIQDPGNLGTIIRLADWFGIEQVVCSEDTVDCSTKINLVMGNEGNGLRKTTEQRLHRKMSIPRFGRLQSTESLNVSIATSIILGEIFSRR